MALVVDNFFYKNCNSFYSTDHQWSSLHLFTKDVFVIFLSYWVCKALVSDSKLFPKSGIKLLFLNDTMEMAFSFDFRLKKL